MHCQGSEYHGENNNAYTVQNIVPVRPDHICLVDHNCVKESVFFPGLHGLMFIKRVHEPGITGMAFIAILYRFFLWKHEVGYQDAVIDLSVAF